jgi:hypothetical protein
MPVGNITRGTTNTNRLRRVDRWMQTWPGLRTTDDPLVVDLGYGASAATSYELAVRLRKTRGDVEVLGLEIDPERVSLARAELARWVAAGVVPAEAAQGIGFEWGGFETPVARGRKPAMIRAFNVLRQYDEAEVLAAWKLMTDRLQPGGVLVEGTCDEIGRISSWIAVTAEGPQTLTIALKLDALSPDSVTAQQYEAPSVVAERLPKSLIHHNVPGEKIHEFLITLDRAWLMHAPLGSFGANQRWIATAQSMRDAGWPVIGGKSRWRLGELTVAYNAIEPG